MVSCDSIVAPATPDGESALAVVRVSGPLARALAILQRGGRTLEPRRAWVADYTRVEGKPLDEMVLCFFPSPRSYTGEDVLELSCHGNPLITKRLLEDVRARGARLAEPGEFTRRAFLNGRIGLTEAEAVIDLIQARSERALAAAQRQLRGGLGRRVERLSERMVALCATVEAQIDFPEEDVPGEDRAALRAELGEVRDELRRLLSTQQAGELVRRGARVVLLGEPNSGKSSLFNRLAGFDRALVSAEPGTTRDYLEEWISLGAHGIRITDTAGVRESAPGRLEHAGIARTIDQAAAADALVLVLDATRPSPTLSPEVRELLDSVPALVAVNKIDLVAAPPVFAPFADLPRVQTSAVTGAGLEELRAGLAGVIDRLAAAKAGEDDEVYVNARHGALLGEAAGALERADGLLASGGTFELVACELDVARRAAAGVSRAGAEVEEAVLEQIFARFCIGK